MSKSRGSERGRCARLAACVVVSGLTVLGAAAGLARDVLDPRALPLGDGKVSSSPQRGYVYACNSQFRGGGAQHAGNWIHGSTWDATGKINVQGDVPWADATFSISVSNGERRLSGNGLPLKHTTGTFPVSPQDPAYAIDRNPNRIRSQQIALALPLSPAPAATAQCVPMGMIGVAVSGVAIFNALDAAGRDAVAHEVQDRCSGHPQREGQYHYHGPTSCLPASTAPNALVGYALDGFGIYSLYDESGRELTNADLDECHGRVSRILWNGKQVDMYHYVLTREYPYTIGCFRGTPVRAAQAGPMTRDEGPQSQSSRREGERQDAPQESAPRGERREEMRSKPESKGPPEGGPGMRDGERGPPRRPPQEAIAACAGHAADSQCQFVSPRGATVVGSCRSPGGTLVCVPQRL